MGVVPEQFALVEHCTHWFVGPLSKHTGVAPEQSVFAAHCAHWPVCAPLATHTGASEAAAHSALAAHARHVSALAVGDLSHMGVFVSGDPSHWASVTHATQAPAIGSPAGAQCGVLPPHCPSFVHGPQVWAVVSQTGALPMQSALDKHCTQSPGGFSQRGVGEAH
jgi:hypothetical protein